MSIYMLNRTRVIGFQSWPFRSEKSYAFFLKFWLWRQVPEKWQVTRDFTLWFILSWGIDHREKNKKTWFEKITSRNYDHPISHCGLYTAELIGLHINQVWMFHFILFKLSSVRGLICLRIRKAHISVFREDQKSVYLHKDFWTLRRSRVVCFMRNII